MAATDTPNAGGLLGQAILAAAMSMPCLQAQAETVPEAAVLGYKYLDYQERQPGEERIGVKAQAWSLLMPFAGAWSLQGSYTKDVVSGASPRFWTKGSASMHDTREAVEASVTRYFAHDTLTLGASYSDENDYLSRGLAVSGTHSTEDKNTTFNYGFAVTSDDITSLGLNEQKHRKDWALGVTQVLTPTDIVQFMLTHVEGKGYYSDPYKFNDARPDERRQDAALLRWNHHFTDAGSTLRLSYRYYTDTWDVKAHSIGIEYAQPLPQGWMLTPSLRLYEQGAAGFYVNEAGFPGSGRYHSYDQRLSAFGARTYGLRVSKVFDQHWSVELMYAKYLQRTGWRLSGAGSPGLAPFDASILQLGVSYRF